MNLQQAMYQGWAEGLARFKLSNAAIGFGTGVGGGHLSGPQVTATAQPSAAPRPGGMAAAPPGAPAAPQAPKAQVL